MGNLPCRPVMARRPHTMSKASAVRRALFAASILMAALGFRPAAASQNPSDYLQGGPTDFYTVAAATPDAASIALTTCFPNNFDPQRSYSAILEMAGYENGSQGIVTDSQGYPHCTGRTTLGQ